MRADDLHEYRVISILTVGYVLIQLLANLTVAKQFPIWGDFSIPIGSLLYAVSYSWTDLVNDRLGQRRARWLVIIGIGANIIMIVWFELYILAPGTPYWNQDPIRQQAISFVLGGVLRIYAASLLTNFIVENVDIGVFHHLKMRREGLPRWLRALISNWTSAPIDAFLFPLLAFGGAIPGRTLFHIMLASCAYKMAVAAISAPLIYLVRSQRIAA